MFKRGEDRVCLGGSNQVKNWVLKMHKCEKDGKVDEGGRKEGENLAFILLLDSAWTVTVAMKFGWKRL